MNQDLFDTLLETHGADLSRWPREYQAPAGHWLRDSPESRQALDAMAELESLIMQAAPEITRNREDGAAAAVLAAVRKMPIQAPSWFVWSWGTGGLTYAGLFVLGSLSNILIRLLSQDTSLDSLFSANLLSPFGG